MLNCAKQLEAVLGYLELGLWDEALAELAGIGGEAAYHPAVQAMRLETYQRSGRWKAMRNFAHELVEYDPTQVQWWVSWAYATRRADSLEEARTILEEAHRRFPEEGVVCYNLGCYACQLGEIETGRQWVEEAVDLEPSFAQSGQQDPDLLPLRDWLKQLSRRQALIVAHRAPGLAEAN